MLRLASRRDKDGHMIPFYSASAAGLVPHPQAVQDLSLWLDASQITGLANNDPVATWNDASPVGATFVQATSGNRPVYKTSQINGLPAVSFNGSNQFMSSNSPSPTLPFTVFAVVKAAATTDGTFWASSTIQSFVWRYNASKYQVVSSNNALICASTSNIDTSAHVLSVTYDGLNYSIEKGEVADGSGTAPYVMAPGLNYLGKDGYGSATYWNGIIAELISYKRVLHMCERASITAYLKTKYAL